MIVRKNLISGIHPMFAFMINEPILFERRNLNGV